MQLLMIFGVVVAAVLISSTVSRVFGKYIDLKREKIGGSSGSMSQELERMSKALQGIKAENEVLQKRLEQLEGTVTSDTWEADQAMKTMWKTIGKTQA